MIRAVFCRIVAAVCLFLLLAGSSQATHQKAAELIVEHVSGYTYRAKLYTYTFTQSPVDRPEMEIFWGDGSSSILARSREELVGNDTKLNYYEGEHTYAGPGTYVLYMEDPNRNSGVVNVPNSVMASMFISTTLVISPWLGEGNSSPVTTHSPVADNACLGQRFVHNPAAYDPDGDLLTYRLIPCRTANGEDVAGYTYPAASDTFYMETYAGNLVWDAPMAQGEYNVAMLIEEWRNDMKIGDMTRDMQIIVRVCDNIPPFIEADDYFCIEAGQELSFLVTVLDQDGDRLSLEASGELAQGGHGVSLQPVYEGIDSAVYAFRWVTRLEDSRELPYQIYFRAEDDGDPHLSSAKTVSVKVMAPAVQFSRAEAEGEGIRLAWNRTPSPHAAAYGLYRRDSSAMETAYDSCQTGIGDSSYYLVARLPLDDTAYLDLAVEEGRNYCYRVLAEFADGSQSRRSAPVCVHPRNTAPLITRASVQATDVYHGTIEVCWVGPQEADSSRIGEWVYHLYSGSSPDSLSWVADFPFDTASCYLDTGLNTVGIRYFYQVSLDTFSSAPVSSVYLSAAGLPGRIDLQWTYAHPWLEQGFEVYRYEDSAGTFVRIASVREPRYVDRDVAPDAVCRYYVEAIGNYDWEQLPRVLRNRSNQVEASARPVEPCRPYLFLQQASCNPLSNTLVWDFDSLYDPFAPLSGQGGSMSAEERAECGQSVSYYDVYRKNSSEDDFAWIASVEESRYTDAEPGSLFCAYRVVGVSGNGSESLPSNELAVDNWHCFTYELPNVFTPNDDGVNDVWRAEDPQFVEEFQIRVVNRWGVEVFRSSDPLFSWNGTMGNTGKACPDGPYFYFAWFKAYVEGRAREKRQSGSVTILR